MKNDKTPEQLATMNSGMARAAAKMEFDAAITVFEGACLRGDGKRQTVAAEAARAALDAHLDAIATATHMARREIGL